MVLEVDIRIMNDEILNKTDIDETLEDSSIQISVRLNDFDGPLDMLCQLIKRSKYSIEDVKISDITEQYMHYMQDLSELDLENATSFIIMAAWLLEIKSRSLLPKPLSEEVETDDPERLLKEKLAEYALYKEASQKMKELETVDIHFRVPDESAGEPRFVLKSMDLSGLMGALQRVFLKLEQRAEEIKERHIIKDRFTVEDRITYIRKIFETNNACNFFSLFDEEYSKGEIISTFQALLELLKLQFISATQNEIFGDIILKRIGQ